MKTIDFKELSECLNYASNKEKGDPLRQDGSMVRHDINLFIECCMMRKTAEQKPQIKIVEETAYRSKPTLNMNEDMVRVVLDMPKYHLSKFKKSL